MNHVMLDLETMGQGNNAAIVAIGAVFFEPTTGEIGDTFYRKIDLESAAQYGEIDPSTVLWWLKQSDAARAEITSKSDCHLIDALSGFTKFISQIDSFKSRVVWGNGSNFDNVIIGNAYKTAHWERPWAYWNDRDVRTVVELGRTLKGFDPKRDMPFTGTAHNALDDAIHQAKYVSAIYKTLA